MTLSANSYGSVLGVAALVPRYTDNQAASFTAATRPTFSQVETWIDQMSAILNGALAEAGFTVPVANADVRNMLALFVNEEVASVCEGINGSGRFGPTAKQPGGKGRFAVLIDDALAFIEGNKAGFERLGAARAFAATAGLAFRDTDNAGAATFPLAQRAGFGNIDTDWDPPQ